MRSFIVVSALLLSGCLNPYTTARQTILVTKNIITVTDAGFQTFKDAKQAECLKQCPAPTDPQYAECIKTKYAACFQKTQETLDIWAVSKRIAEASCAEAEAIVTAAEQKNKGLPVDWMLPVKRGVCVVAQCLDFLPASVKTHIEGILALVKSFTCEPAAK